MLIEIVEHIDLNRAYAYLQSVDAGGINLFVGTVRNHAQGKEVVKLVFEAYEPMALSEMSKIAARAREQWPLSNLIMIHALGEKKIGEAVVVVGAASAHRQACRNRKSSSGIRFAGDSPTARRAGPPCSFRPQDRERTWYSGCVS